VDVAPATQVADGFYTALERGDRTKALTYYGDDFTKSVREWPNVLDTIQEGFGTVASWRLEKSQMAAREQGPCYILDFGVKRRSLVTQEQMTVCRAAGRSTDWKIVGQKITRTDTGQSLTGGSTFATTGVTLP
jgi:hypothetical protein